MGIDYSGSCSWQTLEALVWGLGWVYLDVKAQLLIVLALPGTLDCPRTLWHMLSQCPFSSWE